MEFLLTHPVWDVTSYDFVLLCFIVISTHTSRVGCDTHPVLPTQSGHMISTHTSRVGCDII